MFINTYITIWIFLNLIIIFILSGITIYVKGNIGYLPFMILGIINLCLYLFLVMIILSSKTMYYL